MGDLGPHNVVYDPNTDWDAIANTTLQLDGNSTITADPSNVEMTPLDALYYILSVIFLIIFCFCTRSRIPDERYLVAAAARRARYLEREERKQRMNDPNYREKLVMKSLVIKKVLEEKDGQLTLGDDEDEDDDDLSSGGGSHSIDSTDENVSTCVVCLEAFRVGDVVAWSRAVLDAKDEETCHHVFHKECIVAWLMPPLHDDCPSCRTLIVHEEESDDEFESDGGSNGQPVGPDPYASTAFVIMHGLVSRVRRASYSLVGQHVHVEDDEDDVETGGPPPKPPPSPMRRVFSLEGQTRRRSSIRRRSSHRSISSNRSISDGSVVSVTEATMPDIPDVFSVALTEQQEISPLVMRRVVSDVTRTPPVPLTRESSGSRRFPLSLRPRSNKPYHRLACDSSERSYSEVSLDDEDEIAIQPVSMRDSIGESLSDPTDEENAKLENEPCLRCT
uniref:RING-type domain-containing protein n=1 Tax=Amphora coffeiformis TaxID=265554 RepID=A0A7S3KYR9_9STRA